jgi:glycosyltransferase involved in cell wall biosynthesis
MLEVAPGDPLPAYSWAEVFVLPSLEDGFGFVVAEAMACGLPVLVTDCCGAAGLVRHAESGWIIKAGSVDALRDALEQAARRRSELAAMGLQARTDIERFAAQSEGGAFARSLFPEAVAATA